MDTARVALRYPSIKQRFEFPEKKGQRGVEETFQRTPCFQGLMGNPARQRLLLHQRRASREVIDLDFSLNLLISMLKMKTKTACLNLESIYSFVAFVSRIQVSHPSPENYRAIILTIFCRRNALPYKRDDIGNRSF
jgi:hypothetical protein